MKHFLLPALAFSLAACANQADSMPQTEASSLGGEWQLTEIAGETISGTLHFDTSDNSYSSNAGCNTMFGQYEIKGDSIRFEEPAGTLKGCEPQLMAQDAKLAESLVQGTHWQQQEQTLEIRDTSGNIVIRATRK